MRLFLKISPRSVRLSAATGLLLLLVFFTPFLNWQSTAVWVNSQIALMQLLFVGLLLPEVKPWVVCMFKQSRAFLLTLGFAIVASFGCVLENPDVLQGSRLWLYWIQLFFFIAAVAWFSDNNGKGLGLLAASKLCSIGLVCAFFLYAVSVGDVASRRDIDFHVYRNVRHFNYDLALAVMFSVTLWIMLRDKLAARPLFFLFLIMLGFVSLFTEGRGQLLSVLLFFFIALRVVVCGWDRAVLIWSGTGFLLGAGLLVLVYPETLDWLLARTLAETPDRASAGRLSMWVYSSEVWLGSKPGVVLFGLGPDSFRLLKLSPGYVHPHNSIIQVGMEFGLIGVCFLIFIGGQIFRQAVRLQHIDGDSLPAVVACVLLSMGCYSLLDGILYHGAPLLICVLMGAYLFASTTSCGSEKYRAPQQGAENTL